MTEDGFDVGAWERRLQDHRRAKDEFFETDPDSPLPESARTDFEGLSYFRLDPELRIEARYEPFGAPEEVRLGATRGPDLEYERVGTVGFERAGDHHVLRVYRAPGVEDLLVPFRDETNGRETWQHGRYLSLSVDDPESAGEIVLDFNLAYHPFCVYEETYVSAIPPTENELPFGVRAGERL
jgi:hypothetical protein